MRKTGGRSGRSKRYRRKRRSTSIRKDFVFTFLRPRSASTKLRVPTRIYKGGPPFACRAPYSYKQIRRLRDICRNPPCPPLAMPLAFIPGAMFSVLRRCCHQTSWPAPEARMVEFVSIIEGLSQAIGLAEKTKKFFAEFEPKKKSCSISISTPRLKGCSR